MSISAWIASLCSDRLSLAIWCLSEPVSGLMLKKSLPVKNDLLDWDCAESLVIPDIEKSLDYIQQNGIFMVRFFIPRPASKGFILMMTARL